MKAKGQDEFIHVSNNNRNNKRPLLIVSRIGKAITLPGKHKLLEGYCDKQWDYYTTEAVDDVKVQSPPNQLESSTLEAKRLRQLFGLNCWLKLVVKVK